MKDNQYVYRTDRGKCMGYFNIYQARNGKIMLMMGSKCVSLSIEQVDGLPIDLFSLDDFDQDLYIQAYELNK